MFHILMMVLHDVIDIEIEDLIKEINNRLNCKGRKERDTPVSKKQRFYAVARGRHVGIYLTW